MSERSSRLVCSVGLVVGSALGMAGTFVASASVRGLLWGLDGIALVVAAALLAIYYFRSSSEVVAAGFLVFMAGQTLVVSTAAMDLAVGAPVFGAGAGLWGASLVLISVPRVASLWVRIVGVIAGVLFFVVALQIFMRQALTPLSQPLPFFAYPFFVATLIGWAWQRFQDDRGS
jgi:hypothetical protein